MPSVRGHTITDLMARHGHEQVVFVADAAVGLRAVIAIHSTALGPSLGGVRFRDYETDADALDDVLRLSEAMSLKAAISGLHQGGGKAVVRWDDPDRPRPQVLLDALGSRHRRPGRSLPRGRGPRRDDRRHERPGPGHAVGDGGRRGARRLG